MSSQPIKSKIKSNTNIYMSHKLRNEYFKIPLKNPDYCSYLNPITVKNYSDQKSPNTLPKEYRNDNDEGFNNVCFKEKFQRPITDFNKFKIVKKKIKGVVKETKKFNQVLGDIEYTLKEFEGYGILTGIKNNLTVLDLDTQKWDEGNNHKFIQYCISKLDIQPQENYLDTVDLIVKKINTYTVKSPNGGFHLYFHNKNAGIIRNSQTSIEVDIRGEGGYIIGAYTKLTKPSGDKALYKPFIDKELIDITDKSIINILELFDFVKSFDSKNKFNIDKTNKIKKYKDRPLETRQYKYYFTDKHLDNIEKYLPDMFFIDFMEWKKLTLFYCIIDRKDRWKKINLEKRFVAKDKYDESNNEIEWNKSQNDINTKLPIVEYILKCCGLLKNLPYHKYKPIPDNIIKPDYVFDKSRVSDYYYEDTETIYENYFEKYPIKKHQVIKSGTATGKTFDAKYSYQVRLSPDTPIMSIVSRVSLGEEHQRIFQEYNDDLYCPNDEEDDIIIENPYYKGECEKDDELYKKECEKNREIYKKKEIEFFTELNCEEQVKHYHNKIYDEPIQTLKEAIESDCSVKFSVKDSEINDILDSDILDYSEKIELIEELKLNHYRTFEYADKLYIYINYDKEIVDWKTTHICYWEDNFKNEFIYYDAYENEIRTQFKEEPKTIEKELTVGEIKKKMNRQFYMYNEVKNLKDFAGNNLIIQVDSLLKLDWETETFKNYAIFIDEFNSVFEYLMTSETLKNKRRQVFKLFSKIIKNAKHIILADADISDTALMYLNIKYWDILAEAGEAPKLTEEERDSYNLICPNIEFDFVENKHQHYKGVISEELFDYEVLLDKMVKLDKFMVCCDSATECMKLRMKLVEKGLNFDDICVITSKTDVENKNLDNYKIVIFSPSIVYGLDSQMKREVFCIFTEKTITSKAFLQQIARCRNILHLYYYFPYKKEESEKGFIFNNQNEVVQRVLSLDNYSTNRFKQIIIQNVEQENINEEEIYSTYDILDNYNNVCNTFFMRLLNRIIYFEDCDSSNKFLHFKLGLLRIGYDDKNYMKDLVARDRQEQKQLKKEVKKEIYEIFKSNVNTEHYQQLNKILKLPNEETKLEFHRIFCETGEFDKHLAFCYMYIDNLKLNNSKLESSYNYEFGSHLSKTTLNKINFLKKLFNNANVLENSLFIEKKFTEKEANEYLKTYDLLFRNRKSSKKMNPFMDKYELAKLLKDAIKNLIGFSPYRTEPVKIYIDDEETGKKKRVSRTEYILETDTEEYLYHTKLYSYRQIIDNQSECLIED